MYSILSSKITAFLITNHAVKDEESEIYRYGLELLLSSIVNLIALLFLGYLLNRFFQTILFLLTFCPLRQFSGGIHAANHFRCSLYFTLTYAICVLLEKSWLINTNKVVLLCILAASSLIIVLLSPIEDHNKPLSYQERNLFKRQSLTILAIWNVIIFTGVMLFPGALTYFLYSIMAITLLSALLIIGYKKQIGRSFI